MKNFKLTFLASMIFAMLFSISDLSAQKKPASPKRDTNAKIGEVDVSIVYSSPYKKGRDIWGGLVPYGKVWRTGANEPTKLTVSNDIKLQGKLLKKGTYALFTIPNEDKWTVIINSDHTQWGAYSYDQGKDVMRFDVQPSKTEFSESFMIEAQNDGTVLLMWDELRVAFKLGN